jgi:LPS sulfotransferase NodH
MKRFFKNLKKSKSKVILIVSGLPRSGTSMMMKMLDAAGIPPMTDNFRTADDDNPKGYYEFERVKKLRQGDTAWLEEVEDKAVKIIAALLTHLPTDYEYRVLFMRRKMEEILASQNKMLENREEESQVSDQQMAELYNKHLRRVEAWMEEQPNLTYLDINYNQLLENPTPQLQLVRDFLGSDLDLQKMAAVIDPDLYRQRR